MTVETYAVTKRPDDLVGGLLEEAYTQRPCATAVELPTTSTVSRSMGYAERAGLTLVSMRLHSGLNIAANGTNYLTFQPWMSVRKANGSYAKRNLGTAVATSVLSVVADEPFPLHKERRLTQALPEGALWGVDVTVTGTMGSAYWVTVLSSLRYSG